MLLEEMSYDARAQGISNLTVDNSIADSLSDFQNQFVIGALTARSAGRGRMLDKSKDLLSVAMVKSGESMNRILVEAHEHPSKSSTLSCLSPRDGDLHFREIKNRLAAVR